MKEKPFILEDLVEDLRIFFQSQGEILFCYLFGSFAYRNFTSKSDIDIAVYLDRKKCRDLFKKRLSLIADLSRDLKKETDVIILNDISSVFFEYVILKEGKLIFERDKEKRIEFEMKVLNQYFDFKPIMERYNQRMLSQKGDL
ncbi:MAG: hypothetical protein B5M48_03785 [Candidatus Omnitrophica bacterium 4484_213]|nr:MAG: hypothetical protein B5M48_03785 [Candidatus Omnitrophica bacterium 4484_213]